MDIDDWSVCRVCGSDSDVDITKRNMFDNDDCVEIVFLLTSIKIIKDEQLPKVICGFCDSKLHEFKQFRDVCVAAHYNFMKRKIKSEPETMLNEPDISLFMMEEDQKVGLVEENKEIVALKLENLSESSGSESSSESEKEGAVKVEVDKNEKKGRKKFECPQCDESFYTEKYLEGHLRKHKGLKAAVCSVCTKEYSSVSDLETHIKSRHGAKKPQFTCEVEGCGKTYWLKKSYASHLKKIHEIVKARAAGKTKKVKTEDGAEDTNQNRSERKILTCEECGKIFHTEKRYNGHMREHVGLKPAVCDICNKQYSRFSQLGLHKRVVHGADTARFICEVPDCGKTYGFRSSFRAHLKMHARGDNPIPADKICEECGQAFTSTNSLNSHKLIHTGEKPFQCEICEKKFRTNYRLKDHMIRHAGIKKFTCPYCGMGKPTRAELKTHLNYHTKEKTYPCTLCVAVFMSNGNLKKHVNVVHRGIKAYACTYCDRTFGKPDTLKHHIMTHTGEKPHGCQVCGKRFIQLVALQSHLRTHSKQSCEKIE